MSMHSSTHLEAGERAPLIHISPRKSGDRRALANKSWLTSLGRVQKRVGNITWIWKLKQVPEGLEGELRIIKPT